MEIDNLRAWPWKGNYSQFLVQKEASEKSLGEVIANIEKKIQSTMGAMQQMKRANKYDKSISAKHKMIERMQQELKALKARALKKRKPLILSLEATDKASMDVLIEGGGKVLMDLIGRSLTTTWKSARATASASWAATARAKPRC